MSGLRILLVRLSSMGDVILTTPAIRAVRETFPDATLIYLTNDLYVPLLRWNPFLDGVIPVNRNQTNRSLHAVIRLWKTLERERFDISVDFQRKMKTACLTWGGKIPRRIGGTRLDTDLVPLDPHGYAADRALAALKPLGISRQKGRLEVFSSEEEKEEATRRLRTIGMEPDRPTLGVFPGAGWRPRAWMPERFAEVARRFLVERDGQVLVVGTSQEQDLVEKMIHRLPKRVGTLFDLPLGVLAAILSRCDVFLSNDTGPMHLAVAVGTPTVALFGPGNFDRFAPQQTPHRALRETIACSPCKQFQNHCRNNACMQLISVESVWEAVSQASRPARSSTNSQRASLAGDASRG